MPTPLYHAHNLTPSYLLRYSWTAFPTTGQHLPASSPDGLIQSLRPAWESDGIRLLEHRWAVGRIQATFSTTPQLAPCVLAARAKGRLQHALRLAGSHVKFARNFSVRALGNNTRETVERYVREQVGRGDFADENYRESLKVASWSDRRTTSRSNIWPARRGPPAI